MKSLATFYKKNKITTIAISLLAVTLFLSLIAGVAMSFQTGLTHTSYGIATLAITVITLVAAITYLISITFLPTLKQWRETDAGVITLTTISIVLFITILALMSVALALH